ncbi:MAG: hypothetical protein NXI24_07485 [bacterium]|nr:hypothetical protein [bacterium]
MQRCTVKALLGIVLLVALSVSGAGCLPVDCADSDAYCKPDVGFLLYTSLAPSQASRVYWARANTPQAIVRANVDGTNLQVIGGVYANGPAGLLVDSVAGLLYYTQDSDSGIRRANLDGSNDILFTSDATASSTVGLVLDRARNRLYWFNDSFQLHYVNLSDGSGQTLVRTFASDAETGAYDPVANLWYVSGSTLLRSMPDDGSSDASLDNTYGNIVDTELAPDDRLFVTDIGPAGVFRTNRDGTGRSAVVSGFIPTGVGYDSVADRLYICDVTNSRIMTAGSDGSNLSTLITDTAGSQPAGCALEFSN